MGDYPWASYQYPYHNYNASGSSLIASKIEVIDGYPISVFKLSRPATYKPNDNSYVGSISSGYEIATTSSTTGSSSGNEDFMIFYKLKNPTTGRWENLVKDVYGYGFVDLDLAAGSMPNDRTVC